MENQSLIKLKSIATFLKISNRTYFQNWNLGLFVNFLKTDPEISIIINNLLNKYPNFQKELLEKIPSQHVNQLLPVFNINTFEGWVAFCVSYIDTIIKKNIKSDDVIKKFTINIRDPEYQEEKINFYNDCIEPILIYTELQIKHSLNSIYILHRYKTLCEWYDKDELTDKSEVDITKNHLSKFLFDQGFTHSLSETVVPSGRIDNFALNLGIKKEELGNLPDAIAIEGKILKDGDGKRPIQEVKNQIEKRINELNFQEGFCVVYNKSTKYINIKNNQGNINGIQYIVTTSNKRIFFLIIDLNEKFYNKSIETLETSFLEVE